MKHSIRQHATRLRNNFLAGGFVLAMAIPAMAGNVYLETFDSGTALASDPLVNTSGIGSYWLPASNEENGRVVNCIGAFPCLAAGNNISADASGSGYFLDENTSGNGTTSGSNPYTFFNSASFAVNADTTYTISFDIVNANNPDSCQGGCTAAAQPFINGQALGSVTYADSYPNNVWELATYTWDSESATSAVISLQDPFLYGDGNDFGVDNICVSTGSCSYPSAAPEPASMFLFGSGLLGVAIAARKRKTAA